MTLLSSDLITCYRKFSLIDEVDEEESDCEDALNHNVLSVKETKSSTWGDHSKYQQKSSNTMVSRRQTQTCVAVLNAKAVTD